MNLPLSVASKAARAYQAREDAKVRAQFGTVADPGQVAIAGSALQPTVLADLVDIELDAATARQWVLDQRPVEFVDVRTAAERVAAPGIVGAVSMPMTSIQVRVSELAHDRPVVAYCNDGERSTAAVRFFRERGMEDTWVMKGGLTAWQQVGGWTDAS